MAWPSSSSNQARVTRVHFEGPLLYTFFDDDSDIGTFDFEFSDGTSQAHTAEKNYFYGDSKEESLVYPIRAQLKGHVRRPMHANSAAHDMIDSYANDTAIIWSPIGSSTDEDTTTIVDYDGPNDKEDPKNWTKRSKWLNMGLLALLAFITPLASSMFAPAVPQVLRDLKTDSETLGSFAVSVYILGYAAGPLVLAPTSEVIGRKLVYNCANAAFIVFTVACGVCTSFGQLVTFRFLAGSFGSASTALGSGTISDMFRIHERGLAMSIWSTGSLFGPVIGPIAGSYLSSAKGWRWNFYVVAMFSGIVSLGMMLCMRETYAPVILERKAKRLRKKTGNENFKSKLAPSQSARSYLVTSLLRPAKFCFSPIVFCMSLYAAVAYGYLNLLFTTLPSVFQEVYHFSSTTVGLTYLGLGLGMAIGLAITSLFLDKILAILTAQNGGHSKPEFRIPLMIPAAVMIPAGLLIYGWTLEKRVQYLVPLAGTAVIGVGFITTLVPVMTYLVDAYSSYAASVATASTVLRCLVGALLPLVGPTMYDKLGFGWGNSVLALVTFIMIPVPVLFWRYGERIRGSKRFSTSL